MCRGHARSYILATVLTLFLLLLIESSFQLKLSPPRENVFPQPATLEQKKAGGIVVTSEADGDIADTNQIETRTELVEELSDNVVEVVGRSKLGLPPLVLQPPPIDPWLSANSVSNLPRGRWKRDEVESDTPGCKREVDIACESNATDHQYIEMECKTGIKVLAGSWGRSSGSECPQDDTSLKTDVTDCVESGAFDKAKEMCLGKEHCLLNATTEQFGEPCKGVYKYLNITFECCDTTTTTQAPTTTEDAVETVEVTTPEPTTTTEEPVETVEVTTDPPTTTEDPPETVEVTTEPPDTTTTEHNTETDMTTDPPLTTDPPDDTTEPPPATPVATTVIYLDETTSDDPDTTVSDPTEPPDTTTDPPEPFETGDPTVEVTTSETDPPNLTPDPPGLTPDPQSPNCDPTRRRKWKYVRGEPSVSMKVRKGARARSNDAVARQRSAKKANNPSFTRAPLTNWRQTVKPVFKIRRKKPDPTQRKVPLTTPSKAAPVNSRLVNPKPSSPKLVSRSAGTNHKASGSGISPTVGLRITQKKHRSRRAVIHQRDGKKAPAQPILRSIKPIVDEKPTVSGITRKTSFSPKKTRNSGPRKPVSRALLPPCPRKPPKPAEPFKVDMQLKIRKGSGPQRTIGKNRFGG